MKIQRILVSEETNELKTFYSNIRKIESLIITLFEITKLDSQINTGLELIECINTPEAFLRTYYSNKIIVPEKDGQTGLPINKEKFINEYLQKVELPNISRINEITTEIKNQCNRIDVSLVQVIQTGDILSIYDIVNKKRVEDIADGRFRDFAYSLEEKNFIMAYKELIKSANHLQTVYFKNCGGTIKLNDLLSESENMFLINQRTWYNFKKDCKTRIKA